MSDNKTSKISETPAKAETVSPVPVSPAPKEPKQTSAKSVGAKPAASKIARNAVVGAGDTDSVMYSKARAPKGNESRKSLTVLHIQRRLAEEGFSEAASAPGGRYEALTTNAVRAYQTSITAEPTGTLTREQFADLFEGDHNVTVEVDTHEDHQV